MNQEPVCRMMLGDFRERLAQVPDGSVAGVIADPPYDRKSLPLYQDTMTLAARVLEPGGVLLMILPTWGLPETMRMDFGTLKWRWHLIMDQSEGPHPRMCNSHQTVEVLQKPVGWWYQPGGPRDFRNVRDLFRNSPPSKREHKWTQSSDWANACLDVVRPGGMVIDPMAGTGTLLVAAKARGFPSIGVDIDPEQYERACANIRADGR